MALQRRTTQGMRPKVSMGMNGPSISFGGTTRQTPEEAADVTRARTEATEQGKMAAKIKSLQPRIQNLKKYSDQVPRGSGAWMGLIPNRFIEGAKTSYDQFIGSSPRGVAATQMENAGGDVLAPLVRFSGDTGNIAEWEQKIRRNLLYNKNDSTEMTALKEAHLNELAKIVDDPRSTKNEIDAYFSKFTPSGTFGAGPKFGAVQSQPMQRKSKYNIVRE
jgi:hypothetical protein